MSSSRPAERPRRGSAAARARRAGAGVAFVQLGCPKNAIDGEMMIGLLARAGYAIAHDPAAADVQVVHTCAFLRAAEEESIAEILAAARWKGARRGRRLVVTGCLAERHGAELLAELPEVDALLGPGRIVEIVGAIDEALRGEGGVRRGGFGRPEPWGARLRGGAPHTAYVKIAEGCDHRCAFCLIPRLRGPQRSRLPAGIVREVRGLAAEGAREVVLVAQDTTAYGRDLSPRLSLADLLRRLTVGEGPEWLRLLYTHPARWSEELIDLFARGGRLLPYVDLPVQHASDAVLQAMGRGRGGARIRRLIERLRARIPGLVLRTTVITGHPGEGKREFRELLQFLREFPFDRLGAFAYSPEAGTRAALLPGRAPAKAAEERRLEVLALQRRLALPLQRARCGRDWPVLLEGWRERDRVWIGRSPAEAPEIDGVVRLRAPGPGEWGADLGEFVTARFLRATAYDTFAVPAEAGAEAGGGRPALGGGRRGKP